MSRIIKFQVGGQVHRVRFGVTFPQFNVVESKFVELLEAHHQDLKLAHESKDLRLYYDDGEDLVVLASEADMDECFSIYDDGSKPLKIVAKLVSKQEQEPTPAPKQEQAVEEPKASEAQAKPVEPAADATSNDQDDFVHVGQRRNSGSSSSTSSSSSSEIEFEPSIKVELPATPPAQKEAQVHTPKSSVTVEDEPNEDDLIKSLPLPRESNVILEQIQPQEVKAAESTKVTEPAAKEAAKTDDKPKPVEVNASQTAKVNTDDEKASESKASVDNPVQAFIKLFSEFDKSQSKQSPSQAPKAAPVLVNASAPTEAQAKHTVVFQGVECDGCGQYPLVGVRHKCTECHDFDLCTSCVDKNVTVGSHSPDHILLRFTKPAKCPAMAGCRSDKDKHGHHGRHSDKHGRGLGHHGPGSHGHVPQHGSHYDFHSRAHHGHPLADATLHAVHGDHHDGQTHVFDLSHLLNPFRNAGGCGSASASACHDGSRSHHEAKLHKYQRKCEEMQRRINAAAAASTSQAQAQGPAQAQGQAPTQSASQSSQTQARSQDGAAQATASVSRNGTPFAGEALVSPVLRTLNELGLLKGSNEQLYKDMIQVHGGNVQKIVNDILKMTH